MGLLKSLALLPLAPVQGVVWVAEKIQDQVDRELLDTGAIYEELGAWQAELEAGRITEDEYLAVEEDLLDRVEEIEAYRRGEALGEMADEEDDEGGDPVTGETL